MSEAVNHPKHYNFGSIEVIDVIDDWSCDFYQGNIIKYVARWKHKGGVEDLKKAQWYLARYIDRQAALAEAARQPGAAGADESTPAGQGALRGDDPPQGDLCRNG